MFIPIPIIIWSTPKVYLHVKLHRDIIFGLPTMDLNASAYPNSWFWQSTHPHPTPLLLWSPYKIQQANILLNCIKLFYFIQVVTKYQKIIHRFQLYIWKHNLHPSLLFWSTSKIQNKRLVWIVLIKVYLHMKL